MAVSQLSTPASIEITYTGLSTDTKPLVGPNGLGLAKGSYFNESDTGRRFLFNGTAWIDTTRRVVSTGISGTHGESLSLIQASELVVVAASAFMDTGIQIPVDAVLQSVGVIVTVAIPTAATFTLSLPTDAITISAAIAVAVGTRGVGAVALPRRVLALQPIRLTPSVTPGAGGRVRLTAFYWVTTAPTS